ncbi:divergent polysaccharide deacteylase family protein [Gemmobacter serpentinus]|uniref:divergent polysaccharide deacteylase family protein n=1 Tax=Gemmobacter serpentinus TaxID=2652247 RepID=UPI00124E8D96|nr:divergent polysaccharide deacteylase family protein [Gemmobacter serpentinus]
MRGFLSGVIWGGVVSVLSLGVVSQLIEAPAPQVAANSPQAPAPDATGADAPEAAMPAPEGAASDATASAGPAAEAPAAEGAEPSASEVPAAQPPAAEGPAPGSPAPAGQMPADPAPESPAPETPAPESPAPESPAPESPARDTSVPATPAPEEQVLAEVPAEAVGAAPAAAADPVADAPGTVTDPAAQPDGAAIEAPQGGQVQPGADGALPDQPATNQPATDQPATDQSVAEVTVPDATDPARDPDPATEADLGPLPGEVPAHSPLAPEPAPEPEVAVEPAAPSEPLLDRPTAEAETDDAGAGAGITTNRLPRIEPAPSAPVDPAEEVVVQDDRPLARFKAAFENPANKPLYAILLIDDGKAEIDRAGLAALSVPVTIVIDPAIPDAAKLQALYRGAGKEVAMLATGIPKGAKASDLQVTFEAHSTTLPEAVAVVDLPQDGFQNNRLLAADVVPVLKDQGRGLVTFDRGSNAGDQLARREAVPSAVIFRELDADGEAAPLIRRYLDRAAFKAAQDGRVAVLGHATPETITAVLEWSLEGRAGSVALAPLTAVMSQPE